MSIRFVCNCGKHLRARESLAARSIICPGCGAPVKVPSPGPSFRGSGLSVEEFTARQRVLATTERLGDNPASSAASAILARTLGLPEPIPSRPVGSSPRPAPPPRPVRPRRTGPESPWRDALFFPLQARRYLLGMAFLLTLLLVGLALGLPVLLEQQATSPHGLLYVLPAFLLPFLLIGTVCILLDGALCPAVLADSHLLVWRGGQPPLVLKSGLAWLAAFLAGPVVLLAAAFAYWIYCGEPDVLDWIILAELCVLGCGLWILARLAIGRFGWLSGLNPVQLAKLADVLGVRAQAVTLAAAAVAVAHGAWAVLALDQVQHQEVAGFLLLPCCCLSGAFWATFLLRWLSALATDGSPKVSRRLR